MRPTNKASSWAVSLRILLRHEKYQEKVWSVAASRRMSLSPAFSATYSPPSVSYVVPSVLHVVWCLYAIVEWTPRPGKKRRCVFYFTQRTNRLYHAPALGLFHLLLLVAPRRHAGKGMAIFSRPETKQALRASRRWRQTKQPIPPNCFLW